MKTTEPAIGSSQLCLLDVDAAREQLLGRSAVLVDSFYSAARLTALRLYGYTGERANEFASNVNGAALGRGLRVRPTGARPARSLPLPCPGV